MADLYLDTRPAPAGGVVGRAMNLTAAALSLSLVAGLGFWGYELLVRDATGVPVVRALEGPMRIAPEEPGGELAENMGLEVNRIAGEAGREAPPEQVVLAPPPTGLAPGDLAAGKIEPHLAIAAEAAELLAEPADVAPDAEPATAAPARIAPTAPAGPVPPAIAVPGAASGAAVMQAALTREAPIRATDLAVAEALAGSAEGAAELLLAMATPDAAVAQARGAEPVRPAPRPERFAATPAATPAASVELDAASLEAGARLVQLGAFPTADEARAGWAALEARLGEFMTGKMRVVQAAETGGQTFWRLRAAGFDDLADARRFCSALVARQADCIPVVHR